MMIQDRASQLRKSIPAAIAELSGAIEMQASGRGSPPRLRVEHLDRAKAAAKEMLLLGQALAAAADAANRVLDPPSPERHEHYHQPPPPTPQTFDPSRFAVGSPRPGSPRSGSAQVATDVAHQE